MKLTPGKHWGMRRLADRDGFCRIVATDQREFLAKPLAEILGVDVAPYEAVAGVVTALASELSPEASALLIDPIRPCDCFHAGHACDKRIDVPVARQRLIEFVDRIAPR